MLNTPIPISEIKALVVGQVKNFFPVSEEEEAVIENVFPEVLGRCTVCFRNVENKYFTRCGEAWFSPFHSGQWTIFLYFLANSISRKKGNEAADHKLLADKIYYLNKIMNSVDIYHEVELPEVFFFEHPLATVLGRAVYADGFMAYQNCTVGGNRGCYPTLGKNFRMMSGSKILGNCRVGDNVTLAAGTYVKDTDIPDGATVFGQSPDLIIKFIK